MPRSHQQSATLSHNDTEKVILISLNFETTAVLSQEQYVKL